MVTETAALSPTSAGTVLRSTLLDCLVIACRRTAAIPVGGAVHARQPVVDDDKVKAANTSTIIHFDDAAADDAAADDDGDVVDRYMVLSSCH